MTRRNTAARREQRAMRKVGTAAGEAARRMADFARETKKASVIQANVAATVHRLLNAEHERLEAEGRMALLLTPPTHWRFLIRATMDAAETATLQQACAAQVGWMACELPWTVEYRARMKSIVEEEGPDAATEDRAAQVLAEIRSHGAQAVLGVRPE